ncbi:MAG: hypothetical protein AAB460_00660 [Patescibacteria group bacterium]
MNYLQHLLYFCVLGVVAFLFHFVWESSHVTALYGGYENLGGGVPITLWAAFGDVLYTFLAVGIVSLCARGISWVRNISLASFLGLALMGLLISLCVEYRALALHRWFYLPAMPIIPYFKVGLSPVLQMILLLPLSILIANHVYKVICRKQEVGL